MPLLSFSSFNELQIIKFFLFYLGGNQQVSRHVSDRADRDPPTQPHERDSPFPVRGEEGSLFSHPHLCPSGHAGKTMIALFPFSLIAERFCKFANFVVSVSPRLLKLKSVKFLPISSFVKKI